MVEQLKRRASSVLSSGRARSVVKLEIEEGVIVAAATGNEGEGGGAGGRGALDVVGPFYQSLNDDFECGVCLDHLYVRVPFPNLSLGAGWNGGIRTKRAREMVRGRSGVAPSVDFERTRSERRYLSNQMKEKTEKNHVKAERGRDKMHLKTNERAPVSLHRAHTSCPSHLLDSES